VDLYEAIRGLYEEKKKLDKLITSLESVSAEGDGAARTPWKAARRRRKFSPEKRREISERMRKYWAARREQNEAAPREPEAAGNSQSDPAELAPAG
jgi:hypothetical protein